MVKYNHREAFVMGLPDKISGKSKQPGCEEIQAAVRKKYSEVSISLEGKFTYPTGRDGAHVLGYDLSLLADMPADVADTFCGVGNPFSIGPVNPGESVLDIGSGAGFDLIMASLMVGPRGRVTGIDLTPAMVDKARENLKAAGITNADVILTGVEDMPCEDSSFDLATSNGVLNLSPLKEKSFREIHRVLKPGGRLQFADIVLKEDLPGKVASSLEAWSD
ncbi:MAG TPA: methyltransferase domain-containing protein [Nitrospirae bacterium]|nr:methyltransferase domain-containing protein [Nitrospirota bacterium]